MEYKGIEFKAEDINTDKMEVSGYISTWDEDLIGDIIHPGAFKKSISEAFPKGKIKSLWEHSLPMGMPKHIEEDSKGTFAVTKLSKTSENLDRLEYMRDGVVDSQSIGFSIPHGKSERDNSGKRHIYEVKLMEYSAVMFPCNPTAEIVAVKNLRDQMMVAKSKGLDPRDNEEFALMLSEMKALIKMYEPQESTQPKDKPLYSDTLCIVKSMGDLAQILNK